jgi:hypothetical protein
MTKTAWTFAPAGVLGQGIADVRGVFRADAARLRTLHGPVAVLARTDAPTAQKFIAQQSTRNDGTTLGIHTPGRPQS